MTDPAPRIPLPKFLLALAAAVLVTVVYGALLPLGQRLGPDHPPATPASTPVPRLTGPPFLPTR